jgi:hypothetical protein
MWDFKRKLAVIVVPAVLAVGATGVIAHAATTPSPAQAATAPGATPSAATEGPDTAAETATETVDANEPSLPGGGHSDSAGQADHQFDGTE